MFVQRIIMPVTCGSKVLLPFGKGKKNIKYIKTNGLCSVNFGFDELKLEGKKVLDRDIEDQDVVLTNLSDRLIVIEVQYKDC